MTPSRTTQRTAAALLTAVALAGGCRTQEPKIVSHRAQGISVGEEENVIENVPLLLAEGFGVEIDIRGDGDLPFELGHNRPEGEALFDVFDLVEREWEPSMAGLIFIIDIANDEQDRVSRELIPALYDRIPGTPLADLVYIVQASNEGVLARLEALHEERADPIDLSFALTLWTVVEFSLPAYVDYLVANVAEMESTPHPKPVILFGVASRRSYEAVQTSVHDVLAVLTDHPRRIRALQR